MRLAFAARAFEVGCHALAFEAAALRGKLARQALIVVALAQPQQLEQGGVRLAVAAERRIGGRRDALEAHPQVQLVRAHQQRACFVDQGRGARCAAGRDLQLDAVDQRHRQRVADVRGPQRGDRLVAQHERLVGATGAEHGPRHQRGAGGDAVVVAQRVVAGQGALQQVECLGVALGADQQAGQAARRVGLGQGVAVFAKGGLGQPVAGDGGRDVVDVVRQRRAGVGDHRQQAGRAVAACDLLGVFELGKGAFEVAAARRVVDQEDAGVDPQLVIIRAIGQRARFVACGQRLGAAVHLVQRVGAAGQQQRQHGRIAQRTRTRQRGVDQRECVLHPVLRGGDARVRSRQPQLAARRQAGPVQRGQFGQRALRVAL